MSIFIIAEIGINHNGSLDICKQLIDIAIEKKHTFISTGMIIKSDIDKAVETFRKSEYPFELMHCVSTYTMNDRDANLHRIRTLRTTYNRNVSYSGHETGLAISCGAMGFGISSHERHMTIDRAMYGSDQAASLEPVGFRSPVGGIRKIRSSYGDGLIKMNPEREVCRRQTSQTPSIKVKL